jgi:hypothetical protein
LESAEFIGMKTAEPNRVVRFLPSPAEAAFLLPLLFLFLRLSGGYYPLAGGDTGWRLPRAGTATVLAACVVASVLLPVNTPLLGALREFQRWRPAYDDGMAIVFRSAEGLACATAGEDVTASASAGVAPADGNQRGREITKTNQRDRRITQPNTRSE